MAEPVFFASEADFRRWLEANHATAPELLAGYDIGRKYRDG